ncbi:MAG: 2-C-methyl-D-erythritol 2,4-cyclodiphosphate synthase [Coriobacteriia bacterium]|nr:2-C-methyl-D-erythritol 2,4-cyclodiphosphate synthase [Coriobacteriia bacterium]
MTPRPAEPVRPATHEQATHVGLGFDVHAFAPAESGRKLVLGGVTFDSARGLLGHSDADVLTHAVMDALLGAARLGDIGEHFPDSSPEWAGADSLLLLQKVKALLAAQGRRVLDIDCVVMAEEPRIAPYRQQMREKLAGALDISVEQVGVKATTTERLGFVGRAEGIAAAVVALVAWD